MPTRTPRRGSCWLAMTSPCPPRSPPAQLDELGTAGGCAAGPGRRGCAGRAGDPVPGRGAGAAGPVPQRPARRGGADRRRDGCPPPGHGRGPAAGLPGSRRAGVPDRRPVGRPRRGLAGTGPGLHRRPVQGRPRAADPHPPPPGQARRPPSRGPARQHGCRRGAAVPARGLPGPARPGAPRQPDPPGGVLVRRRRARRARRPGRARRRRPRSRPVPGRCPAAQERRRIR